MAALKDPTYFFEGGTTPFKYKLFNHITATGDTAKNFNIPEVAIAGQIKGSNDLARDNYGIQLDNLSSDGHFFYDPSPSDSLIKVRLNQERGYNKKFNLRAFDANNQMADCEIYISWCGYDGTSIPLEAVGNRYLEYFKT